VSCGGYEREVILRSTHREKRLNMFTASVVLRL
jgi:hypothetical protein